jgi:hypothetical protein
MHALVNFVVVSRELDEIEPTPPLVSSMPFLFLKNTRDHSSNGLG